MLVDSPHPIQFKAAWTDERESLTDGSATQRLEEKRKHALSQLEIMMRSIVRPHRPIRSL